MARTKDHYPRRAAEIIRSIRYATLATVTKEGEPWNSPVFALHNSEGNIYWISDKEGQHSRNVRHNGKVFIVIYDSTVPEGQGEGVYIKARATQVEDAEEIRSVRRMKGKGDDPSASMGNAVRRVYKAVPQEIWMNEAEMEDGMFVRDYRVALSLAEVCKDLRCSS